jgi:hypothetical protein
MDRTMASEAVGSGSIPLGTTNHLFLRAILNLEFRACSSDG